MLIQEVFSFRAFQSPQFLVLNILGLMWEGEERVAICLVYSLPSVPQDTLLDLLEVISGWTLECPRLLVIYESLYSKFL